MRITKQAILDAAEELISSDFCEEFSFYLAKNKFKDIPTEYEKKAGAIILKLYHLLHSYNKNHSCYQIHKEWREEFNPLLQRHGKKSDLLPKK